MIGQVTEVPLIGRDALGGWITQRQTAMPTLRFSIEVGPLVDGDLVALRWRLSRLALASQHIVCLGHCFVADFYRKTGGHFCEICLAGIRGAARVSFTGIDILRIEDGRIAEYWVNSDTALMMTQLQGTAPPSMAQG